MNESVYVVFDCDVWKSRSSMRLVCVCEPKNLADVYSAIQTEREYTDEDMDAYIYIEKVKLNEV